MAAQPQIQGIHDHVELSLESRVVEDDKQPSNLEKDESALLDMQNRQTQTVSGSQVVCAISRMAAEEKKSKRNEQVKVLMATTGAVLAVVMVYAAIVLI